MIDYTPTNWLDVPETARVYISGPMTGLPNYNHDEFVRAEKFLRDTYAMENGFNPAKSFGGNKTLSRETYMRKDIEELLNTDVIVVLGGWEKSRGALVELIIARELCIPVFEFSDIESSVGAEDSVLPLDLNPVDPSSAAQVGVLEEAAVLTSTTRQNVYGHPLDDFSKTTGMLNALFKRKLKSGEKFEPEDLPLIMICVKLARLEQTPGHRDSIVDICGYANTYDMVMTRRAEEATVDHHPV